jgi:signal transduction histidine kinase/ligand-binding sensor domain-containing protein/DNA-binding response OmpR family regulator
MGIKLFFLSLALIGFTQHLCAVEFEHLKAKNGLSDPGVRSIMRDSKGFLWIGTHNGLNRYDGYNIKTYRHNLNDSTSISGKTIYCIHEDSKQQLWVGTWGNGLNLYDRKNDNFIRFKHDVNDPTSISNNWVMYVFEDRKGRLWIGTQNGLNLYNSETGTFKHFLIDFVKIEDRSRTEFTSIFGIVEDFKGILWMPTWSGLIKFDPSTENYSRYTSKSTGLDTNRLQAIFIDDNNNLWIGSHKGALHKITLEYYSDTTLLKISNYYENKNNNSGPSNNRINCITADNNGDLWIATQNGLNHFNKFEQRFDKYFYSPNDEKSVGSNIINCVYYDNAGILWVGTMDNGVSKYDPSQIKFQDNFPFINRTSDADIKFVKSLYQDKDNKIWIGTDYGLLEFSQNHELLRTFKFDSNKKTGIGVGGISGINEDSLGNLWVCTWGDGIALMDKQNGTFKKYSNTNESKFSQKTPGDNAIRVMAKDGSDNFWLGTSSGFLDKFNPHTRQFKHFFFYDSDSIRGLPVVCIAVQNKETVWAGAIYGGGLLKIDQKRNDIVRYTTQNAEKSKLLSNEIYSLFVDHEQNLWVGTDLGLYKYEEDLDQFEHISGKLGFPSIPILHIEEDFNQNLWLSTNVNLICYNKDNKALTIYDDSDGLQLAATNGFLSKSGEMFFTGINGVDNFYPEDVTIKKTSPSIVLTDFLINNQSINHSKDHSIIKNQIDEVDQITLKHNQNFFSFEFAMLNFSQPKKNSYAYMLKGFEEDFNYSGNRRTAFYTNVPPGEYTFLVKASNNYGYWNDSIKQVNILIKPPWYKTIWAYCFYLSIILFSVFLVIQLTITRERWKNQLTMHELRSEKQNAISKKEKEVNELKLQFFTNISHEFRTPLTLVLGPLKDLLKINKIKNEEEQLLKVAYKNAQRLLRLINQVLEVSKIEAGFMRLEISKVCISEIVMNISDLFNHRALKRKINYIIENNIEKATGFIDVDKLDKILYNLLSNAFKFTPDNGTIRLEINCIGGLSIDSNIENLQLKVSDNGPGMDEYVKTRVFDQFFQNKSSLGSGIGLYLAKSLVEIHQGSINVESSIGIGSTFTVTLPCKKELFPEDSIVTQALLKNSDIDEVDEINGSEVLVQENLIDELKYHSDQPVLLVVEDNREMREYIKTLFPLFKVIMAEDGEEGIVKATEHVPDMIISDVMMPKLDGIAMTREIKLLESTSHIPIILLTAKAAKEDLIIGLETGADDYIVKPFDSEELKLKVKNQIDTRMNFSERFLKNPVKELQKMTYNTTDKKFLEKLLSVLEQNISNADFNSGELCDVLGLSRAQLYRKVKALTGKTVHEYFRVIRLYKATELLLDRGLTVSEIIYQVGFNSHSYFTRCFKKQFGVIPSEYINSYLLNDNKE